MVKQKYNQMTPFLFLRAKNAVIRRRVILEFLILFVYKSVINHLNLKYYPDVFFFLKYPLTLYFEKGFFLQNEKK